MKARESKNSKKLFILIAVAVALVAGIGFFVFNKMNAASKQEKVPVLLYHHLLKGNEKENSEVFKNKGTTLAVEQFEKQIKYLADNNYRAITAKELEGFIKNKKNLPEKSVLITFDDASKSNYTYAYPILKKYKMHAISFVVTSKISDQEEKFDPNKIQALSKAEMAKMGDVFEFGSHTDSLHKLEKGEAAVFNKNDVEIKNDILKSKSVLKTDYFSYPFGKYNDTIVKVLKDSKFQVAFVNSPGYATKESNILKVNRFAIKSDLDIKAFSEIVKGNYGKQDK
ncbi:polysaccharide deacetylase family protein [Bacillus mycoides]|uniref:polysaccharide deacetylase family protein n=1 Tax=Bacillus mycoides TaxID=1405 RepID=UPI0021CDD0D4|nr:polysaccharide deacetylase family protein [Bacillus mycoides]MCU5654817.1 polysaccharide deacetylase family protein [Bacillus mycoides]